jgi:hypothetical protein
MLPDRYSRMDAMRRTAFATVLGLVLAVANLQPVLAALAPPDDGPASVPVRFEGYLKLMDADHWLVGAYAVSVDAGTVVIEKRGRAAVGAWVSVEGDKDDMGAVTARFITVQRSAGNGGPLRQFSGTVKKKLADRWVIDDTVIAVPPETRITGNPDLGWLVWVVTEDRADSLDPVAVLIEGLASQPLDLPVEFEGVLDSVAPKWSVDGRPFTLDPAAVRIGGDPAPGDRVELQATVAPDGSLNVHLMRVVDTSADARLSALVAAIRVQPGGEQLWDIVMFSDDPYGEPLAGVLHVGANSLVDESRAVVHPGLWAEVQGITLDRDEFQADVVRLDEPVPTGLTGELTPADPEAAAGWYTLAGQRLWLAAALRGPAATSAGGLVVVRGLRLGNGVVLVEHIAPAGSAAR